MTIDQALVLLENMARDPAAYVRDTVAKARNGRRVNDAQVRLVLRIVLDKCLLAADEAGGTDATGADKAAKARGLINSITVQLGLTPEPDIKSLQDHLMGHFNLGKLTPEQFNARMKEMTAAAHVGIGRTAGHGGHYEDGYRDIPSLCKANNTTHWWDDGIGHIGVLGPTGPINWYRMTPAGYSLVGRTRGTGGAKEHNLNEGT